MECEAWYMIWSAVCGVSISSFLCGVVCGVWRVDCGVRYVWYVMRGSVVVYCLVVWWRPFM